MSTIDIALGFWQPGFAVRWIHPGERPWKSPSSGDGGDGGMVGWPELRIEFPKMAES